MFISGCGTVSRHSTVCNFRSDYDSDRLTGDGSLRNYVTDTARHLAALIYQAGERRKNSKQVIKANLEMLSEFRQLLSDKQNFINSLNKED
jgi:predicted metal-dependent HD superfamily phosphohydrolase